MILLKKLVCLGFCILISNQVFALVQEGGAAQVSSIKQNNDSGKLDDFLLIMGDESSKDNVRPPQLKACPKLEYPPRALRLGLEGRAMVDVLIDDNGKVTATRLFRSSGNEFLDIESLSYFYKCDYYPAQQASKAITAWYRRQLNWSISENDTISSGLIFSLVNAKDDSKPLTMSFDSNRTYCHKIYANLKNKLRLDFSLEKILSDQVCDCAEKKLLADKLIKEMMEKTAKEIKVKYDEIQITHLFEMKVFSFSLQCLADDLSINANDLELKVTNK